MLVIPQWNLKKKNAQRHLRVVQFFWMSGYTAWMSSTLPVGQCTYPSATAEKQVVVHTWGCFQEPQHLHAQSPRLQTAPVAVNRWSGKQAPHELGPRAYTCGLLFSPQVVRYLNKELLPSLQNHSPGCFHNPRMAIPTYPWPSMYTDHPLLTTRGSEFQALPGFLKAGV